MLLLVKRLLRRPFVFWYSVSSSDEIVFLGATPAVRYNLRLAWLFGLGRKGASFSRSFRPAQNSHPSQRISTPIRARNVRTRKSQFLKSQIPNFWVHCSPLERGWGCVFLKAQKSNHYHHYSPREIEDSTTPKINKIWSYRAVCSNPKFQLLQGLLPS